MEFELIENQGQSVASPKQVFTALNDRNMLFISHAWEDFEFTKWLALQLAKEGYGVWCDLTKLLGGENWPREINNALQTRTMKFLFVLSRASNIRPDPLGELETARKVMKRDGLSNFIIPLKLDDISRDDVDYRLQEIQSISFESGWADGLSNVLKLLKEDLVPIHSSFSPSAVNEWWKKYGTDACKVISIPETLYSNRFPILAYPDIIHAHFVNEEPNLGERVRYPVAPFKNYILSFVDSERLRAENGIKSRILKTYSLPTKEILAGSDQLIKNVRIGNYYFTRLMNQTFERGVESKGLYSFSLSKGSCQYFDEKVLAQGRIRFTNGGELNSRIKLWGKFKTESWHWALYVRTEKEPLLHFVMQSHVLVRGKTGLHAAPKGFHKSWRNDKWRDKLKASIVHLAEDQDEVKLGLKDTGEVRFSKNPVQFISRDSYEEPGEQTESDETIVDD